MNARLACCLLLAFSLPALAACGGEGEITDPKLIAELDAVRTATAKYKDVKTAVADGYKETPACLTSPNGDGSMGIHYSNAKLQRDPKVITTKPELLLYEPGPRGKRTLTGVEYFIKDVGQAPPEIPFGHVDGPMRGQFPGQPANFNLHVWLHKRNPEGVFEIWNPDVRC